jgi:hypothetical protein
LTEAHALHGPFVLEEKMEPNEIIAAVVGKVPDPAEVIYAFRMLDLATAIVHRIGEDAMALTLNDILLARDEIQATITHYMDEREFLEIALDTWDIVRNS